MDATFASLLRCFQVKTTPKHRQVSRFDPQSASYNAFLWKNPHNRFMKQELTIAFGLLAAGAMMVGWHSAGSFVRATDAPESKFETLSDSSLEPPPILVGQHRATTGAGAEPRLAQRNLGRPRPVSDFRFDGQTTDRAELMLRRARHMIDDGPAFESSVSVQAAFFGQYVAGSGVYIQAGQGAGKARTTLAFHLPSADQEKLTSQATPPQQKVTNLCDGRFVYRLHEDLVEGEQTLEFYDLQKIKNSKSDRKEMPSIQRPDIPLAPGELMASGMAGLLQHLADDFRFAIIAEETTAGRSRLLRGTWQPSRVQSLVELNSDSGNQQADLSWSHLPPNLPHAVELSLDRNSEWELFPSRLTFYQFRVIDKRTMADPVVVIEFQNPRAMGSISDDQFVFRSENLEATDLTQQYLSRLRPGPQDALR